MGRIDFHTHSTASDGSLSPTELVKEAKRIGLTAIALTDHDTISGLDEFMKAGTENNIKTIPGMETSVVVDNCDVHLICLMFDFHSPVIVNEVKEIDATRKRRNMAMIEKLQREGYKISIDDFAELGDASIARGHIAQVLIKNHFPGKVPLEIIKEYLSKGKIGYVQRETPNPAEFNKVIHRAGGKVFVAHINQIDRNDPEHSIEVFKSMLDMGIDGLETRYCEYDDFWTKATTDLAEKYNLLQSGGSDFHGTIKPKLQLGTGYGDLFVPESFYEAMSRR